MNTQRPLATKIVLGKPIPVGERELVPLVRTTTYVRRRAFVGRGQSSGQGEVFIHLRPIAILERSQAGERSIPIPDKTARLFGGLLLAAFIVPLLLAVAVYLTSKTRT